MLNLTFVQEEHLLLAGETMPFTAILVQCRDCYPNGHLAYINNGTIRCRTCDARRDRPINEKGERLGTVISTHNNALNVRKWVAGWLNVAEEEVEVTYS